MTLADPLDWQAAEPVQRAVTGAARPATYDPEERTVDAVIATGTPVTRRDARGPYLEVLDLDGLDLAHAIGAALPIYDGHRGGTVRQTLGIVTAIRREGLRIVATLRFTGASDAAPVVQRIADGTARFTSAGYAVARWIEGRDPSGRRTRTAAAWRLAEVSIVPDPADPACLIRSRMEADMPETITTEPEAQAPDAAEMTRRAEVRTICRAAGMGDAATDALLDSGADADAAKAAAWDAMQTRSRSAPVLRTASPALGDPAATRSRREEALFLRATGGAMTAEAREFAHDGFADHARAALEAANVATRGLSADELLHRAAHTTSDFPLTVANVAGRIAAEGYTAQESPLKMLFHRRDLRDFKPSTAVRLGEMSRLEPLAEGGEITHTSRAENGEAIALRTYARGLNVSRELMVNDDLGLFADVTRALGEAAAQTESDHMVRLLTDPGGLSDGPVFAAARGNLADPGTSIGDLGDDSAIAEARRAMRKVKGLDGKTLVGAPPRYLVVSPDAETAAERILTAITPARTEDANPWSSLTLVVEPRLEGGEWFLFADPSRLPCLTYAHLSAAPGVQIQRAEAWDTLGMKFRAFLDFGCAWTDWRGAYRNAGT